MKLPMIEVGFQVFVAEGGAEVGAVRNVAPQGRPEIVIYVENGGDFTVPLEAVLSVKSQKVMLDATKLDAKLTSAIRHAHDKEEAGK
jgi:hypothetical protein